MVTDPVRTNATPCPMVASSPIDRAAQSRSAMPILTRLPIRKPNSDRNTARFSGPGSNAVRQSDAMRIDLNRWNLDGCASAPEVIEESGECGGVNPHEDRTDCQMDPKAGAGLTRDVPPRAHRSHRTCHQPGERNQDKAPVDDEARRHAQGGGQIQQEHR